MRDPEIPRSTPSWFFREALRRLWVSKRTSFVAVAMITISLLILGTFLLVSENLGRAVTRWQGSSRVTVYLDADATPQQVQGVNAWLGAHRDFAGRRFVSKAGGPCWAKRVQSNFRRRYSARTRMGAPTRTSARTSWTSRAPPKAATAC